MKTPGVGYYLSGPTLPAVMELRRELGRQDAEVQFLELAARRLARSAAGSRLSPAAFLKQQYKRERIPSGTTDPKAALLLSHQGYIVQTYAAFERFLRSLIRQYRHLTNITDDSWTSKARNEQLDLFAQFITNVRPVSAKRWSMLPEVELLDYYRLVRNAVVHESDKTWAVCDTAQKALSKHSQHFHHTYRTGTAPHRISALTFDDFCLYTRAVKVFSNELSNACRITHEQLADAMFGEPAMYAKLLERRTLEYKVRNAIRNRLRTDYGCDANHTAAVAAILLKKLRPIPTRRERLKRSRGS